jgi:hypothetical protein
MEEHMNRPLSMLLLAALALALVMPGPAGAAPAGPADLPRLVVFESFLNPG